MNNEQLTKNFQRCSKCGRWEPREYLDNEQNHVCPINKNEEKTESKMNDLTKEELQLLYSYAPNYPISEIIRQIKYHADAININHHVDDIIKNASWGITDRELDALFKLCEISKEKVNDFNNFLVELKIYLSNKVPK